MAPMVIRAYTGGVQQLTTTYADVAGSSIAYTPQYENSKIFYSYNFLVGAVDVGGALHVRAYVNGVEQTNFRSSHQCPTNDTRLGIEFVYENASLTEKTLKLQAREYDSTLETKLHETRVFDGALANQASGAVLTIMEILT